MNCYRTVIDKLTIFLTTDKLTQPLKTRRLSIKTIEVPFVAQRMDPGHNAIVFGQVISSWVNLQS